MKKSFEKKLYFCWIFVYLKRVKSPAFGKDNVWFLDSPDFEHLPDFRAGRIAW